MTFKLIIQQIRGYWHRRFRHLGKMVLLACLTLILTLISVPSSAQTSPIDGNDKAAVVLDGRLLFEIGNFGSNYTANKRADSINQALAAEVKSPQPAVIEVVQENDLIILRSRSSQRHLLTVTEADVIQGLSRLSQAHIWQDIIQAALRQGQLERTPAYYYQALVFSIVVVVAAIAVYVSLRFFRHWATRRLMSWLGETISPFHSWSQPANLLLYLALLGIKIGLWTAIAFYVTDLFPQIRSWRYQVFNFLAQLFNFLNSPVIDLGDSRYSALQLLFLLGLTVGLWFGVSSVTKLFKSYVLGRTGADQRVQEVVAVLMQYILTFLGLIVLLQIWGLDVGSLTVLASVLGVGIGFGVQNIANNFISGLIITFERPIQVGDFVKVNELMGTVERIGARSTEICTLDNVTIIVPNSRFLESEVINWSHSDPISRLKIPVGVAYGSDVEQVQTALLEAANSHPEVLLQPQPQVWFQGFGESTLNFDLLVWTGDPKRQFKVKSDLNYRIEAILRRYGIEVPFPQRDLRVRSPELEELLSALLQQQSRFSQGNFNSTKNDCSGQVRGDGFSQRSPLPQQSLNLVTSEQKLTAADIQALVRDMRQAGGLEIKDRCYRLNIYPQCFIGAEAVEWLVQRQNCSRQAAIELGQVLLDQGIIHHVLDENIFQDNYSFYRFYADE